MKQLNLIRKENIVYMFIALLLIVSGYIYLRYAYHVTDHLPFTQEIVLVVLGTIVTILITAILLNKQTEVELKKEENIKFIELKTNIYLQLLDHLEDIILKKSINQEDFIKLRFLTHKLSLVASPPVLIQYEKFVKILKESAQDRKIEVEETDVISEELARLSVKIRADLVGQLDEESAYTDKQISHQIMANMKRLIGKKIILKKEKKPARS